MKTTRSNRGFTLVEVMLALAILGMALVMLMRSAAGSLYSTAQAQMLGVAVDLSRGKMYDLEELLAKEGLGTSDREEQGDFEAEGWPLITWEAKIEQVELPNLETMKEVGQNATAEGGVASTATKQPGLGSGSGSAQDAQTQTSGFIEQFYGMISELLKVGLRKVTLVVKWKVAGRDRDLKTILYVTDSVELVKAADSVMGGLGGGGGGSGGEEGSGSGSSNPFPRTGTPSPGGK